jgi:hypothetical protein
MEDEGGAEKEENAQMEMEGAMTDDDPAGDALVRWALAWMSEVMTEDRWFKFYSSTPSPSSSNERPPRQPVSDEEDLPHAQPRPLSAGQEVDNLLHAISEPEAQDLLAGGMA